MVGKDEIKKPLSTSEEILQLMEKEMLSQPS